MKKIFKLKEKILYWPTTFKSGYFFWSFFFHHLNSNFDSNMPDIQLLGNPIWPSDNMIIGIVH